MSKENEPVMKIVSEADKDDKNKTAQVNNEMQKIGKKSLHLMLIRLMFVVLPPID